MKPLFSTSLPKIKGYLAILSILILASCGTYNNTTQMEDGIYRTNSTTAVDRTADVEATPEDKNSYYQQYFKTKAQNLEAQEDEVFTDIEAYSTYETLDQDGYVVEQDLNERYGAWGENDAQVTINVYDNGWGNYNFWNYGNFNYWGYNNYYFRPGWFVGYGWNGGWGGFNNGWGWNGGWGYTPFLPYWGSIGSGWGFNPFWGGFNGYYGNPYCYNNPYNNGWRGNAYAYQGQRNDGIRGRSSQDYTTRRNTGNELRSASRASSRNSLTSRRSNTTYNNTRSSRSTLGNRVNTRTRNTTTQRSTNTRTRPTTTRPASRSRSNVSRPSSSRSSRSSSVRSSSSSRSSGSSTRSSSSRSSSSSRRGGK